MNRHLDQLKARRHELAQALERLGPGDAVSIDRITPELRGLDLLIYGPPKLRVLIKHHLMRMGVPFDLQAPLLDLAAKLPSDSARDAEVHALETKIQVPENLVPAGPRVLATFHPQVWVRDDALEVDPSGLRTWDVTEEIQAMGREPALALEDDDFDSDDLRHSDRAPVWIKDWSGPFWVEVAESIQGYFDALGEESQA